MKIGKGTLMVFLIVLATFLVFSSSVEAAVPPQLKASKTITPSSAKASNDLTIKIRLEGIGEPALAPTPADIVLLVDRSGSMKGQKLIDAKNASKTFVDLQGSNNRAELISFAGSAIIEVQFTTMTADGKTTVKNAIDKLTSVDKTNIYEAIDKANKELETKGRDKVLLVEILLTDGRPTTGNTKTDDIIDLAVSANVTGIRIYTIGLGKDVDANLLSSIANATGAKYYFAPTSADLQAIYTEISQEISKIVGTDIKVREELPTTLVSYNNDATVAPTSVQDGKLTWNVGTLNVGEVWEVTFTVHAIKDVLVDTTVVQTKVEYILAEATHTMDVTPGIIARDVSAVEQVASKTTATTGEIVQVNVTVKNLGSKSETFSVGVYYNDLSVATRSVTLGAGASSVLTFNWNTTNVTPGTYNISAKVDPGNLLTETNETNNVCLKPLYVTITTGGAGFPFLLLALLAVFVAIAVLIPVLGIAGRGAPPPAGPAVARPVRWVPRFRPARRVGFWRRRVVCPVCFMPVQYDPASKRWYCPYCQRYC